MFSTILRVLKVLGEMWFWGIDGLNMLHHENNMIWMNICNVCNIFGWFWWLSVKEWEFVLISIVENVFWHFEYPWVAHARHAPVTCVISCFACIGVQNLIFLTFFGCLGTVSHCLRLLWGDLMIKHIWLKLWNSRWMMGVFLNVVEHVVMISCAYFMMIPILLIMHFCCIREIIIRCGIIMFCQCMLITFAADLKHCSCCWIALTCMTCIICRCCERDESQIKCGFLWLIPSSMLGLGSRCGARGSMRNPIRTRNL